MTAHPTPRPPLVTTGAFRIAPARNGQPLAFMWKFWVSGSEVYATRRASGVVAKFSMHQSGQIHVNLGYKEKGILGPAALMPDGIWTVPLVLSFLLSGDAYLPPPENLKKKEKAFLWNVPADRLVSLVLVIGPPDATLPPGRSMWTAKLADGGQVALMPQLQQLTQEHLAKRDFLRNGQGLKLNFGEQSKAWRTPYVEIIETTQGTNGGNIVYIVPMGGEAIRTKGDRLRKLPTEPDRAIEICAQASSLELLAPNGMSIATLQWTGGKNLIDLRWDEDVSVKVGRLNLFLHPENIISGEKFRSSNNLWQLYPILNSLEIKNWGLSVRFEFDGETLKVAVWPVSGAYSNANCPDAMPIVHDHEEVVLVMPHEIIVLAVSNANPTADAEFCANVTLRDL